MSSYWHEANPTVFIATQAQVVAKYPTLRFEVKNRRVLLRGTFSISDANGVVDYYHIAIVLPPDFPNSLPLVREVGCTIPLTAHNHMFTNGLACVCVEEEWRMTHPHGFTLLEYLDGPVHSFFLGQSMVKLGLPWPFGERSHQHDGILECYAELLGISDLAVAEGFLRVLAKKEIKGHHPCPCGSGKRLRQCHRRLLLEVRSKIPRKVSERSLLRVIDIRNLLAVRH